MLVALACGRMSAVSLTEMRGLQRRGRALVPAVRRPAPLAGGEVSGVDAEAFADAWQLVMLPLLGAWIVIDRRMAARNRPSRQQTDV